LDEGTLSQSVQVFSPTEIEVTEEFMTKNNLSAIEILNQEELKFEHRNNLV